MAWTPHFIFAWVLGVKLRLPGFRGKCLYLLSPHFISQCLLILVFTFWECNYKNIKFIAVIISLPNAVILSFSSSCRDDPNYKIIFFAASEL